MYKLSRHFLLAVTACFVGLSGVKAEDGIKVNLNDIDCREMLKMEGQEKRFTLLYFHGFMSGKKSEMVFDSTVLTNATDGIEDHCIDNPSDKLINAFDKFR